MKQRLVRDAASALPACLITFLLFLLCSRVYGLFPCGGNSVVWCDMEQQAVPLLVQFKQLVQSGETITYSLLNAGGMQFYGIFFFFLSNPLSLLVLVCDTPADLLVNLLVFIKLALASGTAALWLRRRVPELANPMCILLAVMYGCSGYGLFYYQNLMWLDILLTFPLLMLTLRHLLNKGSALPYCLMLSAVMILCFYLCYMIILFVIIYVALSLRFLYKDAKLRGTAARRFWTANLLAACMTAAVWLPCFLQVIRSARSGSVAEHLMQSWLFNHLQDKLGVLFCTTIVFAVIPVFLRRKAQTDLLHRDRRLFLLLLLAILLDPICMMWQTGSYQAFPLRFGMIPVLLLLTLTAEQFTEAARCPASESPQARSRKPVLSVIGILIAVLTADALLILLAKDKLLSYAQSLWLSPQSFLLLLIPVLLLFLGYTLLLRYHRTRSISLRGCTILAALLFCCEFAMNFHCYVGSAANDDALFAQSADMGELLPDNSGDAVARVRLTRKYTHANLVGALMRPTLAHYTSMTRSDFLHGVKRMGYSSYWMEVNSVGGTVLTDALWHVRYLVGVHGEFPEWTEQINADGSLAAAESHIVLPAAVAVDAAPAEIASLPDGKRADVQQFLGESLLNLHDFITEYPCTKQQNAALSEDENGNFLCTLDNPDQVGSLRFSMFVSGKQALYFDLYSQTETELQTDRDRAVSVAVNGKVLENQYPESSKNGLITLGVFENSYVTVLVKVQQDFTCESFGVFGMDLEQVAAAVAAADGTDLTYRNGTYTAEYHADSPKTLLFSVAYDEGFTASVNGKTVPVYRVCDCMTAVEVPAGSSAVVLRFHVSGLRTGCLIAAAGLLLAAFFGMFLRKRLSPNAMRRIGTISYALTQVAYGAVIAVIYCLPVILWAVGSVISLF